MDIFLGNFVSQRRVLVPRPPPIYILMANRSLERLTQRHSFFFSRSCNSLNRVIAIKFVILGLLRLSAARALSSTPIKGLRARESLRGVGHDRVRELCAEENLSSLHIQLNNSLLHHLNLTLKGLIILQQSLHRQRPVTQRIGPFRHVSMCL